MGIETSEHHNIPSSRGGSSRKENLSVLRDNRHTAFHQWAWNYPPDMLMRLLAFHSVRLKHESLPPGSVEDILAILSSSQWESQYVPEAFDLPEKRKEKSSYFHTYHTIDEMADAQKLIGTLVYGEELPQDRHEFYEKVRVFFRTSSPQEVLQKFLTERHGGQLSWVKAFRDEVRSTVLHVVNQAALEKITKQTRDRFAGILVKHVKDLALDLAINES